MTNPPPAVPPPWRPRGYTGTEDSGDDPTLVDLRLPDPTQLHPPVPPPPTGPYAPVSPPPWPLVGDRRRRHGWLIGFLACGGLFGAVVVLGLLYEPRLPEGLLPATTVATVPPPTVPTTVDAGPGRSREAAAPAGTPVIPAKGWTMAVTSVDLDADAEVARATWYRRPGRGNRFVRVTVDVTHQGEHAGALFGEMKMALVTPAGTAIRPTLNPISDTFALGEQLPPSGRKSGSLLFEMKKADIAGSVLRVEPMFSLDPQQDQRFIAVA